MIVFEVEEKLMRLHGRGVCVCMFILFDVAVDVGKLSQIHFNRIRLSTREYVQADAHREYYGSKVPSSLKAQYSSPGERTVVSRLQPELS